MASTCSCTAKPSATTWSSISASSCGAIAFTQNGWVQSYGSRCVKPPIIYGDVCRPEAMTVGLDHVTRKSLTDEADERHADRAR